jgi:hypothetical protein
MRMIPTYPDLQKTDLPPFGDLQTHTLQYLVYRFARYYPPIFSRTHEMIHQHRHIVRLVQGLTFHPSILPPFKAEASFGVFNPEGIKFRVAKDAILGTK